MQYLVAALIGLASGVTSGLLGVGGGIVMVPAMMILMGIDIKTAIGTSLAVIIPTALMGAGKHYFEGNVDWKVALSLAPMAIVGGYLGAWLTTVISPEHLRRIFGLFMLIIGIKLLLGK